LCKSKFLPRSDILSSVHCLVSALDLELVPVQFPVDVDLHAICDVTDQYHLQVEARHKRYREHFRVMMNNFNAHAGAETATPYLDLAFQTMSCQFRYYILSPPFPIARSTVNFVSKGEYIACIICLLWIPAVQLLTQIHMFSKGEVFPGRYSPVTSFSWFRTTLSMKK